MVETKGDANFDVLIKGLSSNEAKLKAINSINKFMGGYYFRFDAYLPSEYISGNVKTFQSKHGGILFEGGPVSWVTSRGGVLSGLVAGLDNTSKKLLHVISGKKLFILDLEDSNILKS